MPPRSISVVSLALLPTFCFGEAQTDREMTPSVSFSTFPLQLKRIYVSSSPGTPVSKAKEMDSPFPDDVPPATVVAFEDLRRYPSLEKGPRYMMTAKNILRVFNVAAVKTAPYQTIQKDIERLGRILKSRPDSVSDEESQSLPDYPRRNAGHLIAVKLAYIDASWGSGLLYVTQFVQGIGEWPDNEELVCLLQGLTKDNRFYVSADFRVTHPALGKAKPRTDAREDADKLTEKLARMLAKDRDEAFTPSLKRIREWAATLKID
jgi:hypothetical protein